MLSLERLCLTTYPPLEPEALHALANNCVAGLQSSLAPDGGAKRTFILDWKNDAGQDECEHAVHLLEEEARKVQKRGSKLRLFPMPLYAGLPAASQQQVFEPTPRGYRKVGSLCSDLYQIFLVHPLTVQTLWQEQHALHLLHTLL